MVSPQSSLKNILFIWLYATNSCLYDLHTFLLHFWRFCLMYGIWPSLLRCLHKSKIYSYISSHETPTTWLLWFHFCFCGACVFLVLLKNIMKLAWLLTFWQCIIQTYVYNCVILMMKLHQKTTKSKELTVFFIRVFCNITLTSHSAQAQILNVQPWFQPDWARSGCCSLHDADYTGTIWHVMWSVPMSYVYTICTVQWWSWQMWI